jgi:hypothetical protein
MLIAFLVIRGDYENRLFRRLVEKTVQPGMSRPQAAIVLKDRVYELMKARGQIYGEALGGPFTLLFTSFATQLNAPDSVCGSASGVLVRALQTAGFPARYVQMTAGNGLGAHIMVEAEVEPGHWAVLCPTFGVHLTRPDGKLAGFEDVRQNFEYYRPQFPAGYNFTYKFEDVRYTNWQRIPVVLPAMRWGLSLFMSPESLRTFCLRSCIKNYYYLHAVLLAVAYGGVLVIRTWVRRRALPVGAAGKGSRVPGTARTSAPALA